MSFLWFISVICLFVCLMKRREQQTEGWKSKDLKVSLARKEFSYICTCAYLRPGSSRFLSSQVLTRGCWSHQDPWFSSLWKSCCCPGAENGCTSLNLAPQRQVLFLWRKLWWKNIWWTNSEAAELWLEENVMKNWKFPVWVFLDFRLLKSTWMLATSIDAVAKSEAGFQWWSSPWRDVEVFLACSTLMHLGWWICSWPVWLVNPTVWNLMWHLPCCLQH